LTEEKVNPSSNTFMQALTTSASNFVRAPALKRQFLVPMADTYVRDE